MKIKMNPNLIPWVLDGRKTATTRLGDKTNEYNPNDKHVLVSLEDLSEIPINITKMEVMPFKSLSLAIAMKENYTDLDIFKNKLKTIYGTISQEQLVTVIHFELK